MWIKIHCASATTKILPSFLQKMMLMSIKMYSAVTAFCDGSGLLLVVCVFSPALTLFVERTKTLQHSCVRYLHFAVKLCLALISSNSLSCALKRKVPPSNQCWVGCHDILLVLWVLMRAVCQPATLLFAIVIRNYIFNRPKMQLHKYEVDAKCF